MHSSTGQYQKLVVNNYLTREGELIPARIWLSTLGQVEDGNTFVHLCKCLQVLKLFKALANEVVWGISLAVNSLLH